MLNTISSEQKTIDDFGEQWTKYNDSEGYYGSLELFQDILGPLLQVEEIKDSRVAEIGSGAGRIVDMLLNAGAKHVTAIEPSEGYYVMEKNLKYCGDIVSLIHDLGTAIPRDETFDFVFSIGVIQFIPYPKSTIDAAFESLKPGGKMFIWVYSYENNELYVRVVQSIRFFSTHIPHFLLAALVRILDFGLVSYMFLCKFIKLPFRDYFNNVLCKFTPHTRRIVIYDQLNPTYVKYHRREEAAKLLSDSGFVDIQLHHRHGYSWCVLGTKPTCQAQPNKPDSL